MFGLIGVDSVEIKYEAKERDSRYANTFPGGSHATSIVEAVGMFLFALYHVSIIIVLINMLIAMMSHSFEDIQVSEQCTVLFRFLQNGSEWNQ
jgi:Ion transport protein